MASYTYSAVGNKEDLVDIITNITPDETPLLNMFGTGTAKAMTHAWLTDSLEPAGVNKHLEDAEYVAAPVTPRQRFDNYVQIFMKSFYVTESQEAVDKAGVKSEKAYQAQKAMKGIARDVELALLANSTKTAGDATNPGQMGGLRYFNTVNVVDAAGAGLTETMLNDAIQKSWEKGGVPELVLCSGGNKRKISGFTAGTQKTKDMNDKKLVQVIDVYESDFGIVKMQAHRMQGNDHIDIIEKQYFKVAYLIPFKQIDLPKTGLKEAKAISGQLTLECRSADAQAAIINLV